MELGNMIFGNSRGEYGIEKRNAFEEILWPLFDELELNGYGHNKSCTTNETYASVDNEMFTIRPYYWGDNEAITKLPSFVYKPTGLEIQWYKYPLRDAYSNKELTEEEFTEIIDKCIEFVTSKPLKFAKKY